MKYKAIACISLITATQASNACTCAEPYDKQFMDTFEHVVVATVLSVNLVSADRRDYQLAIQESIKGGEKITVVYTDTRSNCASNFRQGENYIIFTNAAPKNRVSVCSSRLMKSAAAENETYQKINKISMQ